MGKTMTRGLVLASLLIGAQCARADVFIDFDDGTNGQAIGTFYSSSGVTFSNAEFNGFISGNEGSVGAGGLKFIAIDTDFQPKVDSPIIAVLDTPSTFASVRGLNVGANGARIDAYDAVIGGNLVDFDEAFGLNSGVTNHPLLSVSGAGIRRLEFYQPRSVTVEGLLFDNLTVRAVPEPSSLAMCGLGSLLVLTSLRRRRKGG